MPAKPPRWKALSQKRKEERVGTSPLVLLLISFVFATSLPTLASAGEQETFSATLVDFEGEVVLQKLGEEIWLPVERDIPIEQGDRLKTGNDAYVEILVDDGSLLKLEENSEITLSELSADFGTKRIACRVFMWFGRLLSNIEKFKHSRSRFNVHTPTMIAGVRGTEFIVETTDSVQTDVGVFEGKVSVGGVDIEGKLIESSEVLIAAGNQTSIQRHKRPLPPFKLKLRMLLHKRRLDILRKKAIERRRDLPKIMDRRRKAREKIHKRWKKLREERHKRIENPVKGTRLQKATTRTRPKKGVKRILRR